MTVSDLCKLWELYLKYQLSLLYTISQLLSILLINSHLIIILTPNLFKPCVCRVAFLSIAGSATVLPTVSQGTIVGTIPWMLTCVTTITRVTSLKLLFWALWKYVHSMFNKKLVLIAKHNVPFRHHIDSIC